MSKDLVVKASASADVDLFRFKVTRQGVVPDEVCSALYVKAGYEDRSRGHSFVIRALLGRAYSPPDPSHSIHVDTTDQ